MSAPGEFLELSNLSLQSWRSRPIEKIIITLIAPEFPEFRNVDEIFLDIIS